MSDFDKWAGDLADQISGNTQKAKSPRRMYDSSVYGLLDEELWEYNKHGADGDPWMYPCRGCSRDHEVYEPEEFDPDMHYCGGSPSCCP